MSKNVKRFASKAFFQIVDLDVLDQLLAPYADELPFAIADLPADVNKKRWALHERFLKVDESFPVKLVDALHCILRLSDRQGLQCLQERADLVGVQLVPMEETKDERDGRHLHPQHVALSAYLHHPEIFEKASDFRAFVQPSSPKEFNGAREGIEAMHGDSAAWTDFRQAVSDFFSERYLGRHCEIRSYVEDDEINILIQHGRHMLTTPVEEKGVEAVLSFRELRQDTVRYQPGTGQIRTSAESAAEKKKLADLFAKHLLGEPDFFNGADSENLYTLQPVIEQGAAFEFKHRWDKDLKGVRIAEIQAKEMQRSEPGRRRGAPWTLTVRDSRNAITRMLTMMPWLKLDSAEIVYLKLDFEFDLHGKSRCIMVKIKPPDTVGFRRDIFESRILEHLHRNGFCIP